MIRYILAQTLALLLIFESSLAQFQQDDFLKSFDGEVNAIEIDYNLDRAYIGGEFSTYGFQYNSISVFDRENYQPITKFPLIYYIDAATSDGEGGWIVCTDWMEGVDETSAGQYNFIHIHADMTWEVLPISYYSATAGFDIGSLTVLGDLLVVKDFSLFDVYNWHTGEEIHLFNEEITNISSLTQRNDTLFMAGGFTSVDGEPRELMCAFDANTYELLDWSPPAGFLPSNYNTHACTLMGITDQYFYLAHGQSSSTNYYPYYTSKLDIVRVNRGDMSIDVNWYTAHASIQSYCVGDDGYLSYIMYDNGISPEEPRLVSLNMHDSLAFENSHQLSKAGLGKIQRVDDVLIVCGGFEQVYDTERVGLMELDAHDLSLRENHMAYNGRTNIIANAIPGENGILITDNERYLGGYRTENFASIDLQTGQVLPFALEFTTINQMQLNAGGDTLFVIGSMPEQPGTTVHVINPITESFHDWIIVSSNATMDVDLISDKVIFQTSGTFTIDGQSRSRFASYSLETHSLDIPLLNINGAITGFLEMGDTLVISGGFTNVNGQARQNIAFIDRSDYSVLDWDPHLENIYNPSVIGNVSACRYVFKQNDALVMLGWFGPNTDFGYPNTSLAAIFDLNTAERLPGFYLSYESNVQTMNAAAANESFILATGFMYSGNPTTMGFAGFDRNSGQAVPSPIDIGGSDQPFTGGNDIEIYEDKAIIGGYFFFANDDNDYTHLVALDLSCSGGQLHLPDSISFCPYGETSTSLTWSGNQPDTYTWEWSSDDGATWNQAEASNAFQSAGMQLHILGTEGVQDQSLVRVIGWSDCDTVVSNLCRLHILNPPSSGAYLEDNTLCEGAYLVIQNGSNGSITWSDGFTAGQPYQMNAAGSYQLTGQNTSGCFAPDTLLYTVYPSPSLAFNLLDSMNCDGSGAVLMLQGSGGLSPYSYFKNGQPTGTLIFNATEEMNFSITDAHGCSASAQADIPYIAACYGCTTPGATNYNPLAVFPEECIFSYDPCIGDINTDGTVDINDLLLVMNEFGCVSGCQYDSDGDGITGTGDIINVVATYGLYCSE